MLAALCLLGILSGCKTTVKWFADDPPMTNLPPWAVEQK